MKITNVTERKPKHVWAVGDFYLTENGKLGQVSFMEGKGYYVHTINKVNKLGDNSYQYFASSMEQLEKSFLKDHFVIPVTISRIEVEEI